ncbi:HTH DNA binding domain protein [Bacillus phage 000TH008]|nr:HTH DNA binding domain protein [Bacillus phage 000TH008]QQO40798.1 HTH DNA binding domain protein [Bacillus phage 000TH009]
MSKVEQLIDMVRDFEEEEVTGFNELLKRAEKIRGEAERVTDVKDKGALQEIIAEMYQLGASVIDIQKRLKVSAGFIYSSLDRFKVPRRAALTKGNLRVATLTKEQKQGIINDYLSKVSLELIYKKYNINKNVCYKVLDEAGIERHNNRSVGAESKSSNSTLQETMVRPPRVSREEAKRLHEPFLITDLEEDLKVWKEETTKTDSVNMDNVSIRREGNTCYVTLSEPTGKNAVKSVIIDTPNAHTKFFI